MFTGQQIKTTLSAKEVDQDGVRDAFRERYEKYIFIQLESKLVNTVLKTSRNIILRNLEV